MKKDLAVKISSRQKFRSDACRLAVEITISIVQNAIKIVKIKRFSQ